MQTDSLLTECDRNLLGGWMSPNTMVADPYVRIAREIARLEQENQRLRDCVDSLDCAHKLALGEVEGLKENEDHLTRLAILGPALTAARAEIQRLRSEMEATEAVIAECTKLRAEVERLKKDNHRLRLEAEGLEEVARRWQASWNVERTDLSAFRAEIQRLRSEMEATEAVIAECTKLRAEVADMETEIERLTELHKAAEDSANYWLDQYKARNDAVFTHAHELAIARNQLEKLRADAEKPHDHGPKPKERGDQLILDGILERISTLEGRVQGITETAKERLDSHDLRLRTLEGDARSARENFFYGINPQNKQPVQPARNPFEDLRPPRGM